MTVRRVTGIDWRRHGSKRPGGIGCILWVIHGRAASGAALIALRGSD
jgi:hypothetical protein